MISAIAEECREVTIKGTKADHRCVTLLEHYTTIQDVSSHLCTHVCMQRQNCKAVSYNREKRYCQLTSEECEKIVEDLQFTVTKFYLPPCLPVTVSPCVQWVPVADVIDDMRITCDPTSHFYVGRLVLQEDIVVGKFATTRTYVWKNGVEYSSPAATEVLQITPGCSANWVPYLPGDPIPNGTVFGGYLGDSCAGIPVISGVTSGDNKRCGYYNPETQLGYMVYFDPEVATEMDILVVQEAQSNSQEEFWTIF